MWSSSGLRISSLLFILFINDITSISKLAELFMFADDTNLFFKYANINELFVNAPKNIQMIQIEQTLIKH